jgi:hypothetical protein
VIGCAALSPWWLFLIIPAGLMVAFIFVPILVDVLVMAAQAWKDMLR